jgi:glycerol-3-phosphate dehydrogenase
VRENEPNISREAVAALSIPSGGIVDVVRLTVALADHSAINGTRYFFRTEVAGIVKEGKKVVGVETNRGRFFCRYLVNCAGVHADAIMNMAGHGGFSILPRKGEYYILDKSLGGIVSRPCFPIPSPHGKGILIFPTVDGNAIIGGDSVPVGDREDTSATADGFATVQRGVRRIVPRIIDGDMIIAAFSGIRATSRTGDFFIGDVKGAERLLNVAGIASPGLSAAPAIAPLVVSLLERMGLSLRRGAGKSFDYRLPPLFKDADDPQRNEMLRRDPRYARVVCRCEGVTEGDIVEAIRAPVPALTLDAIKFRARAGAGRCQGAFDLTRIIKILCRERGCSPLELEKNEAGSRILEGYTKPQGRI